MITYILICMLGFVLFLLLSCYLAFKWTDYKDKEFIRFYRSTRSVESSWYKPTVYYSGKAHKLRRDGVEIALLTPWHKHPKSGEEVQTTCMTSNVLVWGKDGRIETLNTHYVPLKFKLTGPPK
jgi:hypothetical protein